MALPSGLTSRGGRSQCVMFVLLEEEEEEEEEEEVAWDPGAFHA